MKQPILIAQELRKAFGDNEAVRGISFSVMRGEIFSLLGPNGAGKTTTINMLSCLIEPTGGTAEIAGHASAVTLVYSGDFTPEGGPTASGSGSGSTPSLAASLRW